MHTGTTEGRVGVENRLHVDVEGETAGHEGIGNALCLIFGETAGNTGTSSGNGFIDRRSAVQVAVEDDRQLSAHVVFRDPFEVFGTFAVELEHDPQLSGHFIPVRPRHGDIAAIHFRLFANQITVDDRFAFFHFGVFQIRHAFGDLGIFAFVDTALVGGDVRFHQTELKFGTHLDDVAEFDLLIFGDDRGAQYDTVFTGGGDFRLINALTFQTFAESFHRHVTVTVEVLFHALSDVFIFYVGISDQLQIELHTSGEVKSQTDGACRLFADQAYHVAVVVKVSAFNSFRQIYAFFIGGGKQGLRLENIRICRFFCLGIIDQCKGDGIFRVFKQIFKDIVVIFLCQRVHRRRKNGNDQHRQQSTQSQRFFFHNYLVSSFFSSSTRAIPSFTTSTRTFSAISTTKSFSLTSMILP